MGGAAGGLKAPSLPSVGCITLGKSFTPPRRLSSFIIGQAHTYLITLLLRKGDVRFESTQHSDSANVN